MTLIATDMAISTLYNTYTYRLPPLYPQVMFCGQVGGIGGESVQEKKKSPEESGLISVP